MRSRLNGSGLVVTGLVGVFVMLAGCGGSNDDTGTSESSDAPRAALAARLLNASPQAIAADTELTKLVEEIATPAVAQHCASCHGADLRGKPGVPDLLDGDWLWGSGADDSEVGAVRSIERTLLYGVRNRDCAPEMQQYGACADTRFSQMPGYSATGVLPAERIADLVEYLLQLGGQEADAAAATRAETDFKLCTECHGEFGEGNKEYGGADLSDEVWLYGGDKESLRISIADGREGICPPWGQVLDAATIKALAVHIQANAE